MANITQVEVENFLKSIRGQETSIDRIMLEFNLDPSCSKQVRAVLSKCYREKLCKPLPGREGKIKVLKEINPVRWWTADENKYFDLAFPRGHLNEEGFGDESSFGFEKLFDISPGDLIVIGGVSNYGKSGFVLNILGENVDKHPCVLMGNEYTTLDGMPSPKFKRRMKRMSWVEWMNGVNEPKFDLLPVKEDWEDYIQSGKINIIDWINLTDNFYKIGKIFEDIKTATGNGVSVPVLQKKVGADTARGGDFSKDLADIYMLIDKYGDESRITFEKVKEPKGKIYGRHWAFRLVDGGANFCNIREIRKCSNCWGSGYKSGSRCESCYGKGFVEIDDEY